MKLNRQTILLRRVRVYARHGVEAQEQLTGAYFYVDMAVDTDFSTALQTDDLTGTVSYADLFRCVKEEMAVPSRLVEHAAGRILERIFRECPSVTRIRLTLTKENPPMGADCHEAGIEVEAERGLNPDSTRA